MLAQLERWGARHAWVGPDPYEGLNSALARIAPGRRGRQAVTQAYKLLPFAPPWPLRARPSPNAKALALALAGYASPAGQRLTGAERFLERLPLQLAELNLLTGDAAWGYPFDVQTRNIRYRRTTPNAVVTAFVVEGLLDAHAATGSPEVRDLALSARGFLLSLRRRSAHGPFFAYVPAGSDLIHNASLLVCAALARLDELSPDPKAAAAAREAAETTAVRQPQSGVWPYGEALGYNWSDSFHTAYTLEGFARTEVAFGCGTEALDRGVRAWLGTFLDGDWAKYYPDRRFPLEAHTCATAIDLLCQPAIASRVEGPGGIAQRIASCAIERLWLPSEGRFAFKLTPRGLNTRTYMRWTNAPMFRALARLGGTAAAPCQKPRP